MAGKQTSFECTIFLDVKISKASSSKKDESSDSYAKQTLELLASSLGKDKAITIQDQRVVKVGDVDAAWLAFTNRPEGQATPVSLKTHCVMRTAGYNIRIEGHRDDIRPGRTAKDFEESQAEFLKISQTFRVTAAQPAK